MPLWCLKWKKMLVCCCALSPCRCCCCWCCDNKENCFNLLIFLSGRQSGMLKREWLSSQSRWQWLDWKLISLTGENEAEEDERIIEGMNLIKTQRSKKERNVGRKRPANVRVNNQHYAENDRETKFYIHKLLNNVAEHLLHHSFYYSCGF